MVLLNYCVQGVFEARAIFHSIFYWCCSQQVAIKSKKLTGCTCVCVEINVKWGMYGKYFHLILQFCEKLWKYYWSHSLRALCTNKHCNVQGPNHLLLEFCKLFLMQYKIPSISSTFIIPVCLILQGFIALNPVLFFTALTWILILLDK